MFADSWSERTMSSSVMHDAFNDAGIIEWPDRESNDSEAQARYHTLKYAILDRTVEAVREAIGKAFVEIANDVLERERKRNASK